MRIFTFLLEREEERKKRKKDYIEEPNIMTLVVFIYSTFFKIGNNWK